MHHYKEKLQQTKETHLHYQNMYEKEIRRTRKEAFKSSSALVRMQEELKGTRDSLARMRSRMEEQKSKTEEREKEAFAASYRLVEVQQELTKMQEVNRQYEEEAFALGQRLLAADLIKCEELVSLEDKYRMALEESEKKAASVKQQGDDDERLTELEQELRWARKALKDAEGQVEFMKIECQFRCCSCRVAERKGITYEYGTPFMDEVLASIREMEESLAGIPNQEDDNAGNMSRVSENSNDQQIDTDMDSEESQAMLPPDENMTEVAFCPQTGTFHTINNTTTQQAVNLEHSSNDHNTNTINNNVTNTIVIPAEVEGPILPQAQSESTPTPPSILPSVSVPVLLPEQPSLLSLLSSPMQPQAPSQTETGDEGSQTQSESESESSTAFPPSPERHCSQHQTRTITTTTLIPLADSPPPVHHQPHHQPKTPSQPPSSQPSAEQEHDHEHDQSLLAGTTMTRQQAIEQIRIRRGRARSIAAGAFTPRRQMVDAQGPGLGNRRDISAPGERGRRWDN